MEQGECLAAKEFLARRIESGDVKQTINHLQKMPPGCLRRVDSHVLSEVVIEALKATPSGSLRTEMEKTLLQIRPEAYMGGLHKGLLMGLENKDTALLISTLPDYLKHKEECSKLFGGEDGQFFAERLIARVCLMVKEMGTSEQISKVEQLFPEEGSVL